MPVSSKGKKATPTARVKSETHSLGALLRKLRRDRNLTQQEVAEYLGLSRDAAYQKYEHGTVIPPPDKLAKLADLFSVTTDYLLGRESRVSIADEQLPYQAINATELSTMACKIAYNEIMRKVDGHPRKQAEFRTLLEDFRASL